MTDEQRLLGILERAEAIEKPRRWPLRVILTVALVLLVGGGIYLAYRRSLANDIERRLDAIRRRGEPTTLAELDTWYAAPAGANAADIYEKAFAAFAPIDDKTVEQVPVVGDVKLPPPGQPIPDKMRAAADTFLQANAGTLDLLREAAAVPDARYPVHLTAGVLAELSHLVKMRASARLLALEAVVRADDAGPAEAAAAVSAALAIPRSLRREPLLISFLVARACETLTVEALGRVLSRTSLDGDDVQRLSRQLDALEEPDWLRRALMGERCMVSGLLQTPPEDLAKLTSEVLPDADSGFFIGYRALGLWDKDHVAWLTLMEQEVAAAGTPLSQRRAAAAKAQAASEAVSARRLVTRMMAPELLHVVMRELRTVAALRAARVGLAVDRFREEQKRLPVALADLVPRHLAAVPADPFDGKPLRYRALAKGYVVYSVGDDGVDDGGKELDAKTAKGDIVFPVTR